MIYKKKLSDDLVQIASYIREGDVIFPVYQNFDPTEKTEETAIAELQVLVKDFKAPEEEV